MTDLTWRSGRNDDVVWLQYGDFAAPQAEALLSLVRYREAGKVEIQLRLHHLDGAASRGVEIPRRVRFSLGAGEPEPLAIEGVGFVTETRDGRACFTTGQGRADEDLSPFRPVLDRIGDGFEITVEGDTFFFPIDAKSRSTLIALFS
ncbi:hypothetical protein [Enterovirga sp.]|uniref:hypothetical protein n=1 Tax=Enterovirga sp. TaxID=2026350 RepID=UPI002BD93045|nr:hypothetical protein [Enterovirga sp.]HMO27728.1 hypothetical protein [Enterovirga sp.]